MKKLIVLVSCIMLCVFHLGCNYMKDIVGSYGSSEHYEMGASSKKIFEAIRIFKNENPDMVPPLGYRNWCEDGSGKDYLSAHFYYKDKEMGVNTVIHEKGTELIFVSICPKDEEICLGINGKKLSKDENKAAKKEFEQRIVNPIKAILKR